jgi:hypothetical protein
MSDMTKVCYLCQKANDIRPYGPKGQWICFHCMKSSPKMEAAARAQLAAQLGAINGPGVIGEEVGPYPVAHNPELRDFVRAFGGSDAE